MGLVARDSPSLLPGDFQGWAARLVGADGEHRNRSFDVYVAALGTGA